MVGCHGCEDIGSTCPLQPDTKGSTLSPSPCSCLGRASRCNPGLSNTEINEGDLAATAQSSAAQHVTSRSATSLTVTLPRPQSATGLQAVIAIGSEAQTLGKQPLKELLHTLPFLVSAEIGQVDEF